jgi:hypothetical protein
VGQINAIGQIPAALEVPWAVLAGLGSGGQAVLTAYQWAGNAAGGGRYSATLQVVTKHFWFVTVQP